MSTITAIVSIKSNLGNISGRAERPAASCKLHVYLNNPCIAPGLSPSSLHCRLVKPRVGAGEFHPHCRGRRQASRSASTNVLIPPTKALNWLDHLPFDNLWSAIIEIPFYRTPILDISILQSPPLPATVGPNQPTRELRAFATFPSSPSPRITRKSLSEAAGLALGFEKNKDVVLAN
ncbi:hypothetical protein VTH06DRAFT_7268 [Thermothelomyces fergusii]